ncbi:acyl-CoA dehydrogenase family protein [Zoogloea dura]|uniref:Acyl-CoA/acyl-ACP dehydrogenase n=1 Tax=Zoogloea dura TaxID=2728840 RepID=A0A848G9M4_9RHOO|nr:acyl-CoA dehydrogenase family protein [Zoogloea dura]NML28988.1 acyl-CoA/acyl-ACP dehydrogenase [Zoogloea dura]
MSPPLRSQDEALDWIAAHAASLDAGPEHADQVVPLLGAAGFFRIGVPVALGGSGGSTFDAVQAIARVAERSLTAAFVFWGQRCFIGYLLDSDNAALRQRWLPALLEGEVAGATGLSNAMKFLSGIESLQVLATPEGEAWRLDGQLPWVTNLRRAGYLVAAAVEPTDGAPAAVVAFTGDTPGITRSDDLQLLALRGSNTAAIRIEGVASGAAELIHADARVFLPRVRPAFLGLQCGMSIGLARASLAAASHSGSAARAGLQGRVAAIEAGLDEAVAELEAGLADGRFATQAALLFRIRIRLAGLVRQAVDLELDATGGRAYLVASTGDFARRWLEAAFVPVVTPSLTQLHGELERQAALQAA